jgi:hypothetical protein
MYVINCSGYPIEVPLLGWIVALCEPGLGNDEFII